MSSRFAHTKTVRAVKLFSLQTVCIDWVFLDFRSLLSQRVAHRLFWLFNFMMVLKFPSFKSHLILRVFILFYARCPIPHF
jgi:hypothetical protein